MTRADYLRVCWGKSQESENQYRHTRLILSGLFHKDPREIIPMKGDYDHLTAMSKSQIDDLLVKWGKTDWIN